MIRRPPRSTLSSSSAASDVYKRQVACRHEYCHDSCAEVTCNCGARRGNLEFLNYFESEKTCPRSPPVPISDGIKTSCLNRSARKQEAHNRFRRANLRVQVLGDVVVDKQHWHLLVACIASESGRARVPPARVTNHLRLRGRALDAVHGQFGEPLLD